MDLLPASIVATEVDQLRARRPDRLDEDGDGIYCESL